MDDLRKAAKAVLDYWESAAFGDAVMVDKMDALRTALEQPTADAPLPRPSIRDHLGFSTGTYTADQMLAFRAEGVAQERERCAQQIPDEWLVKVRRLVKGFEHVSGIARLWEPDYSSGSERALWSRATEACADVTKLLNAIRKG